MKFELRGNLELAPYLLLRVLPNRPHLHNLSITSLSELIGWPMKKTARFFSGTDNPNWEDITYIHNRLQIPYSELIEGMSKYLTPDWKEQQQAYLRRLNDLTRSRKEIGEKVYAKNLYNIIRGRYPVHLGY